MQITETEYRQLKAQIDADAKAETDRIEHERRRNQEALDRVWGMIRRVAQAGPADLFTSAATNGNGNGEREEEPRVPFAMKATIREFIQENRPRLVTQPLIYKFLWDTYNDHIAHRDQQQVRGQIANVLSKLSEGDDAILEVSSEALGGNPKIFKLKAKT